MAEPGSSDARILVLGTHVLARSAVARTLAHELSVAVDHGAPPVLAGRTRVAVLDGVHLPPRTVPQLIRAAVETSASAVLLFDSAMPSPDLLSAAQFAGVHSTFDVRGDHRGLADQVRFALDQRVWRQDWTSASWMKALTHDTTDLTPKEQQVAATLRATPGAGLDDLARALGMKPNTVRTHVANIRRKLPGRYTGNREALVAAIVERGWAD